MWGLTKLQMDVKRRFQTNEYVGPNKQVEWKQRVEICSKLIKDWGE